jgi:hypothetical protein
VKTCQSRGKLQAELKGLWIFKVEAEADLRGHRQEQSSIHDAQVHFFQPCTPIAIVDYIWQRLTTLSLDLDLNGRSRSHCAQVNIIQP